MKLNPRAAAVLLVLLHSACSPRHLDPAGGGSYRDPAIPVEDRVADLLERMTSTFDTALAHQVFREVGLEAALLGSNLVLSPVLDLAQDPRWGRAEETYGEDPYLVARMGVAAITGYQGAPAPTIGRRHSTWRTGASWSSPEHSRSWWALGPGMTTSKR